MRILSTGVASALAGQSVAIAQLIAFEFSTTPIYLNTSTYDLLFGGKLYKGAYGLGSISSIDDKPGEVQGITFELPGGPTDVVALALDASDIVQGTPVTVCTAIFDMSTFTILDAPIEWMGQLDTMSIGEDGQSSNIHVTAESRAVDLLRGTPRLYSEADQTVLYPTDHSFKYVVDQIDKPIVWPTRDFFKQ